MGSADQSHTMNDNTKAAPQGVANLLDQLEEAIGTRDRLHAEYMGKAMSDEVYNRFATVRDDTIPGLRKAIAALAQTGQAAPRMGAASTVVADILKDCCECERPNQWDVETVELRVSDLTMILERHIEGKE